MYGREPEKVLIVALPFTSSFSHFLIFSKLIFLCLSLFNCKIWRVIVTTSKDYFESQMSWEKERALASTLLEQCLAHDQCSLSSAALLITFIMRRIKGVILVHLRVWNFYHLFFFGLGKYMCYPEGLCISNNYWYQNVNWLLGLFPNRKQVPKDVGLRAMLF